MHQKGNLGISMNMKRITPKMRAMAGNGEYTVSKDEADKIRQRNEAIDILPPLNTFGI